MSRVPDDLTPFQAKGYDISQVFRVTNRCSPLHATEVKVCSDTGDHYLYVTDGYRRDRVHLSYIQPTGLLFGKGGREIQPPEPAPLPYPKPPMPPCPTQEHKADAGKPDWSLLMGSQGCPNALVGVVDVLSVAVRPKDQGGRGYDKHSWRLVTNAKERYLAALYRHLSKIALGKIMDDGPEGTGLSHWDCVTTNALFLRELHDQEIKNATVKP